VAAPEAGRPWIAAAATTSKKDKEESYVRGMILSLFLQP
jgi:hypothetical protein